MKFHVRDTLIRKNFNVDAFLRLSAEPDIRAPAKEPFLAVPIPLSLQVGAGTALQGLITQVGIDQLLFTIR